MKRALETYHLYMDTVMFSILNIDYLARYVHKTNYALLFNTDEAIRKFWLRTIFNRTKSDINRYAIIFNNKICGVYFLKNVYPTELYYKDGKSSFDCWNSKYQIPDTDIFINGIRMVILLCFKRRQHWHWLLNMHNNQILK